MFEIIFTVEVLSVVITILAVVITYFVEEKKIKDVVSNYQREFKTVGKILRLIGDNYNIDEIEILLKALEESGKLDEFTGDIEEGIKEELSEIKKQ